MIETIADLRYAFQQNRDYERRMYQKATGKYPLDYHVDNPEGYYLKNIRLVHRLFKPKNGGR